MKIDVIIPALNEEASIGMVIESLSKDLFRYIIVCDNGSSDRTAYCAEKAGAIVVREARRGYGSACLCGIDFIKNLTIQPDIILFIDGDFSDDPLEASIILDPLIHGDYELVIGSRVLGNAEKGSLTPVQRFGNSLSTRLIQFFFHYSFSDLGPFRAILWKSLLRLEMKDRDFGWTVEMQVKAAKYNLRCKEVPVSYRNRIGKSKISGTIIGSIKAGYKILYTIFKLL